ncbi:hypothetical protein FIBSPDRAFT_23394 [Athelia psychrophila]|uniref:Uncharacterized protein n=1 Tax=Athelia psychrophila TaxID=1759441 RepID=A0A166GCA8_9AGAM|nr:hypothetical protein FIBSPDRAFT_23394 [Fibularhizoctonia sp. CBS 109695]
MYEHVWSQKARTPMEYRAALLLCSSYVVLRTLRTEPLAGTPTHMPSTWRRRSKTSAALVDTLGCDCWFVPGFWFRVDMILFGLIIGGL